VWSNFLLGSYPSYEHVLNSDLNTWTPIIPKKKINAIDVITTDDKEVNDAVREFKNDRSDLSDEKDVIIPGSFAMRIIRNFFNNDVSAGLDDMLPITIIVFTMNSSQFTG
jgi:hypothetical protein